MDQQKDLIDYTREEFLAIENYGPVGQFNSVIIVPTDEMHDSGFLCMKFIFEFRGEIVGAASGWSDVLHLNGIGGYGRHFGTLLRANDTRKEKHVAWRFDCLPGSKCIRLISGEALDVDSMAVSDYSIYIK